MRLIQSVVIFLASALLEVGGGYLVWLWLKEDKSIWLGVMGAISLVLYGVVATLQMQSFGRVYAAYGGIFVIFSIAWAMGFDAFKPDKWDILGGVLIVAGVYFMMLARSESS